MTTGLVLIKMKKESAGAGTVYTLTNQAQIFGLMRFYCKFLWDLNAMTDEAEFFILEGLQ